MLVTTFSLALTVLIVLCCTSTAAVAETEPETGQHVEPAPEDTQQAEGKN